MNATDATAGRGVLQRLSAWRVRAAYAVAVLVFLWAVAQFYDSTTGFSSLLSIGDVIGQREVTALRQVPHYIYEDSAGYDGAYYVQLALDPTLANPELRTAIDNLPYRARRILFCAVGWLAGFGQPAWIVQAMALVNVACWFALAWVLLRWFPPTDWNNFFRWFAVMFSHGVCMSVRDSLTDGPSLLLVALAMARWESGRRKGGLALLALAGLGKETSLLAVTAFVDADWRAPRTWLRLAGRVALVALPLLAWMGYVRWRVGPAGDPGLRNFTLPLAGLAEKWGTASASLMLRSESTLRWATLAATFALTVQFLFFALRWRPSERWWRVGAVFAGMMLFLSTPVWEGLPGAATRVLLPMTLAFNVLVPRGRWWLAVLIAGNLTVLATYREFNPPPHEFFEVSGAAGLVAKVQVAPMTGWQGPENLGDRRWRWSSGRSELQIHNAAGVPVMVTLRGAAAAVTPRNLRIAVGGTTAWTGAIASRPVDFQFERVLPPGDTTVRFESDKGPAVLAEDPRKLSFNVLNLEVVVKPAAGQR